MSKHQSGHWLIFGQYDNPVIRLSLDCFTDGSTDTDISRQQNSLYFIYNNKHSNRKAIAEEIASANSSFMSPYAHHEAHPNIRIVSVNGCKSCTAWYLHDLHNWGNEAIVEHIAATTEIPLSICIL